MSQNKSLKSDAVCGIGWSFGGSAASYGITFIVGIVLARLLTPEEYGLIGIITIFITIFNGIVDSGFSNALIRKQNATELDNNTVFYTNLSLSLLLYIALCIAAPSIASFFEKRELIALTRIMGLCLIINAFSLIQVSILTKELDFRTQSKCSVISSAVSGIIGVLFAIKGGGVWALVWQQITKQLFNTVLLWLWRSWRPQYVFSKESFMDLFSFGWKMMVSGIINSFWGQIYQVVIGKCYTPAILGQYTRAREYVNVVSQNLTSVIQKVSYPTLSKIQDDKERLKHGYRIIIRMSALVVFVFCLGMGGCAKQLVLVLIGEQWLPCVPMMQIVCFSMALYPIHAINLNMLQVQGRSDLFLKLEIVKKIIGILPILAGIFFNIYWMLIVGFITGGCIDVILNSHYSGKMINYSTWDQVKDLLPSAGIALLVGIITLLIGFIPINIYALLALQVFVGAIVTITICERSNLPEYLEIKKIAMPLVNIILKR